MIARPKLLMTFLAGTMAACAADLGTASDFGVGGKGDGPRSTVDGTYLYRPHSLGPEFDELRLNITQKGDTTPAQAQAQAQAGATFSFSIDYVPFQADQQLGQQQDDAKRPSGTDIPFNNRVEFTLIKNCNLIFNFAEDRRQVTIEEEGKKCADLTGKYGYPTHYAGTYHFPGSPVEYHRTEEVLPPLPDAGPTPTPPDAEPTDPVQDPNCQWVQGWFSAWCECGEEIDGSKDTKAQCEEETDQNQNQQNKVAVQATDVVRELKQPTAKVTTTGTLTITTIGASFDFTVADTKTGKKLSAENAKYNLWYEAFDDCALNITPRGRGEIQIEQSRACGGADYQGIYRIPGSGQDDQE